MKPDKIKCENMLRIHDLKLVDRLQEIYQKSQYRSINEFLNACLKQFAVYDKSPGYTCRECKVGTKELNEIMLKDFPECKKLGQEESSCPYFFIKRYNKTHRETIQRKT